MPAALIVLEEHFMRVDADLTGTPISIMLYTTCNSPPCISLCLVIHAKGLQLQCGNYVAEILPLTQAISRVSLAISGLTLFQIVPVSNLLAA